MRPRAVSLGLFAALSAGTAAAQTGGANPIIHVSAGEIARRTQALGNERASASFPVFEFGGYTLRLEHRTDKPQNASVHEAESELFYVVEGTAVIRTGGSLVNPRRSDSNLTAASIDGGSLQTLGPGDVLLIPPGVAHWVVSVDEHTNLLSLHLPVRP